MSDLASLWYLKMFYKLYEAADGTLSCITYQEKQYTFVYIYLVISPMSQTCDVLFCHFRSICLLMQAALPCFLMGSGPGTMTLRGGTNADMAPPIDYTVMVAPNLITFFVHYTAHTHNNIGKHIVELSH